MREKGEVLTKGTLEGDVEFWGDGTVTERASMLAELDGVPEKRAQLEWQKHIKKKQQKGGSLPN